jgi:hypothetical protein
VALQRRVKPAVDNCVRFRRQPDRIRSRSRQRQSPVPGQLGRTIGWRGTQLVINACSTAASRNWIVRGIQFELSSNAPYMCANVQGNDTADGTPVIAYSCGDAPNELWNFENGEILGLGTQSGTSKCLSVGGTGGIGGAVELSTCDGIYQGWELVNGAIYGLPPALPASGPLLNTTNALCVDSAGARSLAVTPNS